MEDIRLWETKIDEIHEKNEKLSSELKLAQEKIKIERSKKKTRLVSIQEDPIVSEIQLTMDGSSQHSETRSEPDEKPVQNELSTSSEPGNLQQQQQTYEDANINDTNQQSFHDEDDDEEHDDVSKETEHGPSDMVAEEKKSHENETI